jgi:GNAT superfamily N-acetyltransferase
LEIKSPRKVQLMTLKFAPALPCQHEAINRLMLCAFTPYVQKLDGGRTAGPYPWLEAAISRGDVYVGLDETVIVGIVITSRWGDELVIDQLGVDPARQGAGIGSWLLEQIERTARHDQVKALSLQTAEMMSDLLRLYSQHGFLETRRALPAHGDDKHLRVHMKKLL